jgi:hypothetical protein
MPKMTEAQAYLYYELVGYRLFGWNIVRRGRHHSRSKAARAVDIFWRRSLDEGPEMDRFVILAKQGAPVHTLWPEDMQEEIARQINTKVPRSINEPTSAEFIASMHNSGRTDWVLPDFLASHGREPTVEGEPA